MASVSAAIYHPRQGLLHEAHRHLGSSALQLSLATRSSFRCPLTTSPFVGPLVAQRLSRNEAFSSFTALPDDLSSSTMTISIALATFLGFAGFRAFVYFRIQYIIASMLGKCVPRGGCRVLDLDMHEGRNLYYYPNDIEEVVAVTDKKNLEVVKNQAVRAGVPVNVKVKPINSASLPSNSMDAVVSVYCLCDLNDREAKTTLREAIRLLKPGKPFIFLENVVAEGEFLQTCQLLLQKTLQLFGIQTSLPKDIRKVLQEAEGLETLEYETLFGFQDPHIVGLAIKRLQVANSTNKKKGNRRSVSA